MNCLMGRPGIAPISTRALWGMFPAKTNGRGVGAWIATDILQWKRGCFAMLAMRGGTRKMFSMMGDQMFPFTTDAMKIMKGRLVPNEVE
jgi:hypothetical protein